MISEQLDCEDRKDFSETEFGENRLNPELLESTDSEDSTEFTGMDLNDYEIMTEDNYWKMNNTAKNIGWKIPSQLE